MDGEDLTANAAPKVAAGDELAELVRAIDAEVEAHPDEALAPAAAPALSLAERHIAFRLGEARYAVPYRFVVEVGSVPPVTAVPRVPGWVLGVTNLRGEILSVVDLASFLGAPSIAEGGRMLVVRGAGEETLAGLVVSDIAGMTQLSAATIRATTAPIEDAVAPYLAGVVEHQGQVVSILDLERLLSSPEFCSFESV